MIPIPTTIYMVNCIPSMITLDPVCHNSFIVFPLCHNFISFFTSTDCLSNSSQSLLFCKISNFDMMIFISLRASSRLISLDFFLVFLRTPSQTRINIPAMINNHKNHTKYFRLGTLFATKTNAYIIAQISTNIAGRLLLTISTRLPIHSNMIFCIFPVHIFSVRVLSRWIYFSKYFFLSPI